MSRSHLCDPHILLTWEELERASMIGIRRHLLQRQRKADNAHSLDLQEQFGKSGQRSVAYAVGIDVTGAWGELAFAKFLGVPWTEDVDTFKKPDVAGFQVRAIGMRDHKLVVRDDGTTGPYALVLGAIQNYEVLGWIRSTEVRLNHEWIQAPAGRPPAWFVPSSALYPFTKKVLDMIRERQVVADDQRDPWDEP